MVDERKTDKDTSEPQITYLTGIMTVDPAEAFRRASAESDRIQALWERHASAQHSCGNTAHDDRK